MSARVIHSLLVLILCDWVQSDVFTAISDLEPLLETQQEFIEDVNEYIVLEEKRLEALKKRLSILEKEHENAKRDIPDYLGNPISAFSLIKSLTVDLDIIRKITEIAADNSKYITKDDEELKYPSWEDLEGAARAISRLQEVFELDTHELSEGMLKGVMSRNQMTAEDCFVLGRALHHAGDFRMALLWMTEAQRKYKNHSELCQFTEVNILEYTAASHLNLGNLKTAFELAKQVLKMDPEHLHAANFTILCSKLIAEEETKQMIYQMAGNTEKSITEKPITEEKIRYEEDMKNYKILCRGEIDGFPLIEKSLHCEYLSRNHPFLKIAPFKVEHMSVQPDIIVFHDVMSDSEIEDLKRIAKTQVIDLAAGRSTTSNLRISKSAWLLDDASAAVSRVYRRVADMTGLSIDTAEELQVANYGLGGFYTPHYDFYVKRHDRSDDRIATVLFYMSDVALGGATVFPRAGVRVVPKKGTAVFWLNLHPSGEGDLTMRHAACPVLRGSKWVATSWLHMTGQEFLKPCSLHDDVPGIVRKLPKLVASRHR